MGVRLFKEFIGKGSPAISSIFAKIIATNFGRFGTNILPIIFEMRLLNSLNMG
jgi:hypothetical protein